MARCIRHVTTSDVQRDSRCSTPWALHTSDCKRPAVQRQHTFIGMHWHLQHTLARHELWPHTSISPCARTVELSNLREQRMHTLQKARFVGRLICMRHGLPFPLHKLGSVSACNGVGTQIVEILRAEPISLILGSCEATERWHDSNAADEVPHQCRCRAQMRCHTRVARVSERREDPSSFGCGCECFLVNLCDSGTVCVTTDCEFGLLGV